MVVGDVPVETHQILVVVLVGGEVGVGTGVIAVVLGQEVAHGLHIALLGARDILGGVGHTVVGSAPAGHHGRLEGVLIVGKKEELVLEDGSAQSKTVSGETVAARVGHGSAVHTVAVHVLIVVVHIGRALEGVGTRLGDGVDGTAHEVGLPHIEGRDSHLHLLDGIHGDGGAAAGQAGGETEVVVEVGTVETEVGGASVAAGHAHAVGIGRHTHKVGQAAAHGGHLHNLRIGEVGRGTYLLTGETRGPAAHHHLVEHGLVFGQGDIEAVVLAEGKLDAGESACGITDVGDGDAVGATYTHTLDIESSVDIGDGGILCA